MHATARQSGLPAARRRRFRFGLRLPSAGLAVAGLALLWLALFPVIGNALAYPDSEVPRRWYQVRSLCAAALLFVLGRAFLIPAAAALRRLPWRRALGLTAALSVLVAVQAFAHRASFRMEDARAMAAEAAFFLPWALLASLVLAGAGRPPRFDRADAKHRIRFALAAAGLGCALLGKGWWSGPSPVDGALAFGGSPIVAGISAVCAFYMVLVAAPFPLSLACAFPFGVLMLLSTSRTALWAAVLLYAPYSLAVLRRPVARARRLAAVLVMPAALAFAVLVPIFAPAKLLLALPPLNRHEDAVLDARKRLQDRLYRNFRLLPSALRSRWVQRERAALGVAPAETDAELKARLIRRYATLTDREWRLFHLIEQGGEDRGGLYARTLALIARAPAGHFPVP
ncbi:MAG: hypothetical protein AAB368_08405, partial [bacterium]